MAEILAPAGDEAAFYAALNAGADAIYLGLRDFSARKSAANFSLSNLGEYTFAAHLLGAKVYVALNTLVKDAELESFFDAALGAWNAGADALIIQDIFLGKALKQTYPDIVLHLSTQAGVCNGYGARMARRFGFSRVILARETPLAQIAAIAAEIETEVFVQGALCTCFSGQCYLSSLAGGNSGNRGFCKQPCRKRYSLDRPGFERMDYKLSLSDLCVGEDIEKLVAAGVSSFKIEGRMRSAAYVGAAVRYVSDLLSKGSAGQIASDFSDLRRTYNRGDYTRGLAFGQDARLVSRDIQGHKGERIGTIVRFSKDDKFAYIRSSFRPKAGDGFKIIRGGREEIGGAVYGRGGEYREGFALPKGRGWQVGDDVYITADGALSERVSARRRLLPLDVRCTFRVGEYPSVCASGAFGEVCVEGDDAAEEARSAPLDEAAIAACFAKTGEYPFAVRSLRASCEGQCFLVRAALNALRRKVYSAVADAVAPQRAPLERRPIPHAPRARQGVTSGEIAVIADDFSGEWCRAGKIDYAIFKPKDWSDMASIDDFIEKSEYYAWHKTLYLPAFMTDADLAAVGAFVGRFDAVYAEGFYAFEFCKEHSVPLFAGTGLNLFNSLSASLARAEGASRIALSKELSAQEIAAIGDGDAFVLSGGRAKAMDLLYCPFSKACESCDRRRSYSLRDEAGRAFPFVRYVCGGCRFELYNCAALVAERRGPRLYDFTVTDEGDRAAYLSGKDMRERLRQYTAGALRGGIR